MLTICFWLCPPIFLAGLLCVSSCCVCARWVAIGLSERIVIFLWLYTFRLSASRQWTEVSLWHIRIRNFRFNAVGQPTKTWTTMPPDSYLSFSLVQDFCFICLRDYAVWMANVWSSVQCRMNAGLREASHWSRRRLSRMYVWYVVCCYPMRHYKFAQKNFRFSPWQDRIAHVFTAFLVQTRCVCAWRTTCVWLLPVFGYKFIADTWFKFFSFSLSFVGLGSRWDGSPRLGDFLSFFRIGKFNFVVCSIDMVDGWITDSSLQIGYYDLQGAKVTVTTMNNKFRISHRHDSTAGKEKASPTIEHSNMQ